MLWYIKKGDRLVKVTRRSPPYRMLQKQRSILITDSAAQPEPVHWDSERDRFKFCVNSKN